jgi:saccharopine dehydrogenase (NAD+, L-lysine-forming)
MSKIKIGLIKEGKVPPDHRVPMTPEQCKAAQSRFQNLEIIVQRSPIRAFKDEEYAAAGMKLVDDLSECDIIMGVKEVKIEDLIPNKTFLFFSHTIKQQPYNRDLLRAILDKRIRLVDYEVLKNKQNKRVIGFGRYAGIVGAYNAFRTYGLKHGTYDLKPAHTCADRIEMEQEMKKIIAGTDMRIVLTGFGRVGHGAREIVDQLPIKEVSPEEFLANTFNEAVFTHLELEDYYAPKDGSAFDKATFYSTPEIYKSTFSRYLSVADVYIPCHFWSSRSPIIISADDLKAENCRLSVVADISCDIAGPIASTIRPSKIADPMYGYNPHTGLEDDFMKEGVIAVMAVDNLPCELPKDASEDFGNELMKYILPALLVEDPDNIIGRGSETDFNGQLTPDFLYLQPYVDGNE